MDGSRDYHSELNELSQTEKDKYMLSHISNLLKMVQINLFTKQK